MPICKNCGNELSVFDKFCDKCGTKNDSYIDPSIVSTKEEPEEIIVQTQKKKMSPLILGLIAVLLIILGVGVGLNLNKGNSQTSDPIVEQEQNSNNQEKEHVHTVVNDKGFAATINSEGLTDGSHCETCGAVIVAQDIIPRLMPNKAKVVTSSGALRVRSQPEIADNQIGYVDKGDIVTITDVSSDSKWYYIKHGNTEGWASADYLSIIE